MKLSYSWLKEYLECELTPAQVAEAMTSIGIEVDSLEEQEEIPGGLAGVVVAKVVECVEHPDSDHLHITKVDAGTGELLTVVCGAPNVAAGQKVLFATIGTILPGDFKIKKSKIRGVESFGMICAQDELGIGTDHAGIMVLPEDAVVGTPAKEFLHLKTDAVIEYEITANRVDAASHWGVARDLYAYLLSIGAPCKLNRPTDAGFKAPAAGEGIPFEVLDTDGAPRYSGITMKGVKVAPSPEWLQKDLRAIGLNPINNIVDISNFILFELGQPLHIFDAAKIGGGKVVVRRAAEGEILRTLDGVERKLKATDMVIADATKPMCIAGVFGGEDSGVSDSTTDIFIEGAYFDPASIRRTSKAHGLQTDASFRYERGADPAVAAFAGRRAAALIAEVAGGEVVAPQVDFYPNPIGKKEIELDYERIQNFIGKKIGKETIEKILAALQYDFVKKTENGAVVAAPTYMIDVYRECDVVEEILRIYGYNNIELPRGMHASIMPSPSPDPEAVRNYISDFLAANGFAEIMNNSLTKAAYYKGLETFPEEKCVTIVNPLSSDLAVMRQSLIPNALEVAAYNINRQVGTLRTFEYGSVYQVAPDGDKTKLESYEEHPCFCIMMTGPSEKVWNSEARKGNYFQVKGMLELLLSRYGVDAYTLETEAAPKDIFSEGLVYLLPGLHKQLAVMGTVSLAYARRFDVKQPVFVAEISWPVLFELVKRVKVKFSELPRFPEVRRDLALLFDEGVDFASVRKAAFRGAKKLLKQVTLFDVYRGDKIPAGKKQYALGFVFQDLEKTLTDAEIEKITGKLLAIFQNEFGAVLR
ncbi:MAG: phenylalanine--tRNA ligase subunit beta [Bacteroidales bacterium]|nr:phenylalanine--tRNA ligase subunit beta [Bacteroidales bacterium]